MKNWAEVGLRVWHCVQRLLFLSLCHKTMAPVPSKRFLSGSGMRLTVTGTPGSSATKMPSTRGKAQLEFGSAGDVRHRAMSAKPYVGMPPSISWKPMAKRFKPAVNSGYP